LRSITAITVTILITLWTVFGLLMPAASATAWLSGEEVSRTATMTKAAQDVDDEIPPGNPVIGDDRPGDIEPENETRRYLLWGLVAVCLIGAGTLLLKIERWESHRAETGDG